MNAKTIFADPAARGLLRALPYLLPAYALEAAASIAAPAHSPTAYLALAFAFLGALMFVGQVTMIRYYAGMAEPGEGAGPYVEAVLVLVAGLEAAYWLCGFRFPALHAAAALLPGLAAAAFPAYVQRVYGDGDANRREGEGSITAGRLRAELRCYEAIYGVDTATLLRWIEAGDERVGQINDAGFWRSTYELLANIERQRAAGRRRGHVGAD